MAFESAPNKDGIYRIKVLNQDFYLEAIPKSESAASTPWIRLAVADLSSQKQKWELKKVPGFSNIWNISSCADNTGVTYKKTPQTYRGHGFPYPEGLSLDWAIEEFNGQYSKVSAPMNGTDCFDCQYKNSGDDAVHFWTQLSQSQAPFQCFTFEYVPGDSELKMDVLFVQDATGSQQPYIDAAKNSVIQIAVQLRKSGDFARDDDLRFGLISFRDHPPQDTTYVTKAHGSFSSDIGWLQTNFASIASTGGGDGPEAQCDALDDALNAAWRDEASKLVILITDSPPHGVEDSGDYWPDGCPIQNDPCRSAERMKENGIVLNVIACEPVLSQYYEKALNFYRGLVAKTGGDILPLAEPSATAEAEYQGRAAFGTFSATSFEKTYQDVVTGFALKLLDTAKYSAKYRPTVERQAFVQKLSVDSIASKLHSDIQTAGGQHYNFSSDNLYPLNPQDEIESKVWAEAKTLKEARQMLEKGPSLGPASGKPDVYSAPVATQPVYEQKPVTRTNVDNIVSTILRQARK